MTQDVLKDRLLDLQNRVFNRPARFLLNRGLAPPTYALLATTGRRTGRARQVPVANGLQGEGDLKHQALTQRELHVARLAAAGLTNNEIAERLVVSVRTVESHLYHAFDKLGVTSRSELDHEFIVDQDDLLAPR